MSMELQKRLHTEFRRHGIGLRRESIKLVAAYVVDSGLEVEAASQQVLQELEKKNLSTTIPTEETVEDIIALLLEPDIEEDSSVQIISAFEVPKFHYDPIRKHFWRSKSETTNLFGNAESKISIYRDRLSILQHRVQRNVLFNKPSLEFGAVKRDWCELTQIQGLAGCIGETKFILGMLSEIEDGKLFVEDPSGAVPVDISHALTTTGLFTENCGVVAEGELGQDGIFHVSVLGLPPLETREAFAEVTGEENFFGGQAVSPDEIAEIEEKMEKSAASELFVVLSDVWLDREGTHDRLRTVLSGFNEVETVPSLFIFIGNFTSRYVGLEGGKISELKAHFKALGELIASFPRLMESAKFIFVPGPSDPSPSQAFPRPPLPACLTSSLSDSLGESAIIATNPCRIRFFTQEIVIFREDLQQRMQRLTCLTPDTQETKSFFQHVAVTVLGQGHLCPLPITVQPVYWEFDHAMRLYSAPHVLILADQAQSEEFHYQEANSKCFNPGSFGTDGSFAAYRPVQQVVELSAC
ncbi:hypothetical protein CYMTET_40834 [Cymbomonas tetramitiformis]|uniref:DNA polymerase epsilon subunit n=1 Tax=Cymbomonas tetramitiformis TaxID=36881 RepID=A0AAE0C919_9CHLO|nr:hypothetical protein CYMTET_40834 [Cymbomonas tetramitiformis]